MSMPFIPFMGKTHQSTRRGSGANFIDGGPIELHQFHPDASHAAPARPPMPPVHRAVDPPPPSADTTSHEPFKSRESILSDFMPAAERSRAASDRFSNASIVGTFLSSHVDSAGPPRDSKASFGPFVSAAIAEAEEDAAASMA